MNQNENIQQKEKRMWVNIAEANCTLNGKNGKVYFMYILPHKKEPF